MATPRISSTNVGVGSSLKNGSDCNQSTDISLASLCTGSTYGSITNTFGADGGPLDTVDKVGGTNNPLSATQIVASQLILDNIEAAPFNVSHTIGGEFT
tara:strand:- start:204 stop:500 length:297 start_codon:yes stop_codon:yes gene_type:complete